MSITRFQFKARGKQYVLASKHDEEVARLNEAIKDSKDRLERMTMQAEWVVESYDKYLVAQTNGRLDDIKEKSIKFSRCLSGLDLLARRERISE